MGNDVQGLRKGIDLILYEREKQQNNFIIHTFYLNAVHKVARIAERYKLMNERYHTVCELYNENADQIEPFEFFSYFATFCTNFKKTREDNKRRELAEYNADSRTLAPGQYPQNGNGSLVPAQHVKNDELNLPSHPVLGVTSKRS